MEIYGRQLGYCTNVHPGEGLEDVGANIENYVAPVGRAVCPGKPFGVGLRLSYRACRELLRPDKFEWFSDLLHCRLLYPFTINGFIYGRFHGERVKERVYLPDWASENRLEYSNLLAKTLARMLPEGNAGTISTVAVGFAPDFCDESRIERAVEMLLCHVANLDRIFQETGRFIVLALEPEPGCVLENIEDTLLFFREYLFCASSLRRLQKLTGKTRATCEEMLRKSIGICYDACHMAIAYENPKSALERLKGAGISVAKIHISSAPELKFQPGDIEALELLALFIEPIYLHQVVENCRGKITAYPDLPQAIDSLRTKKNKSLQWRIHFHVPVFLEKIGRFATTQEHITQLLPHTDCRHFEVETYTWGVLPEELREKDLVKALSREINWAKAELAR